MRAEKRTRSNQRRMSNVKMTGRHEPMMRRAANRNAHVITPHGKIISGRKGRRG